MAAINLEDIVKKATAGINTGSSSGVSIVSGNSAKVKSSSGYVIDNNLEHTTNFNKIIVEEIKSSSWIQSGADC